MVDKALVDCQESLEQLDARGDDTRVMVNKELSSVSLPSKAAGACANESQWDSSTRSSPSEAASARANEGFVRLLYVVPFSWLPRCSGRVDGLGTIVS